jgi:putative hydrolase
LSGPRIKADLHVHTVASGHAYSTVRENCAEAANRGIELIAIADHGPAMPGGPHAYHFANLLVMPRVLFGVKVLRSAECNIISPDGEIDLPERALRVLDMVLAGMHPYCGYEGGSALENTRTVLKVIESGVVDVLVHPGNPRFPLDYETVVKAAASNGVLIEVNNASFSVVRDGSVENCRKIVREAVAIGAPICVGSDAHDASMVGVFDRALELVDETGLPDTQIANRDADSILAFLDSRGKDISF